MNPLTRQELQLQLQQTINTIINRLVTREMFINSIERVCTKQDAAVFIDSSRQKILEKVTIPTHEQQMITRQIFAQYEALTKTLRSLEEKLDSLDKCVKTIQSKTEPVINQNKSTNPTKTVLEQLYA